MVYTMLISGPHASSRVPMGDQEDFFIYLFRYSVWLWNIISTNLCSIVVWLQLQVGFWQGTHSNLHLMYYVFHTRGKSEFCGEHVLVG